MADQPLPPEPDPGSNASSSPDADPGSAVSDEQSLNDVVALARDIVLYAPIALVLDAPTLLPKLAEQGKVHVRNARALGPHALRRIHNRLVNIASNTVGEQAAGLLRQLGGAPEPSSPAGSGSADDGRDARDGRDGRATVVDVADGSENGRSPAAAAAPPSPAVEELAIPDYDSLSALQVVDRLPGLTAGELEAVRAYEAAHRGRKTILNKAAQLQA
jgi:hypothetical protein